MSDLLPPNAAPQERALSLATARLGDVPVPLRTLHDAATCPAALLPWLAWAESVDDWDASWTEARKRAVIAASREVHEKKGTAAALKAAIGALGFGAIITEWFQQEPPGTPYTFAADIVVDQESIPTLAIFDQIVRAAERAKNLRSHFTGVGIRAQSAGTEYVGAASWLGEIVTIAAEPA